MTSIGIAAAKAQIAALVDRAAGGEDIVITRNGVPVARLLAIDREGELAVDHAHPPTVATTNGSGAKPTPAPRIAPPAGPNPTTPRLRPQAPGLTLAEILKAAR